jgi:hypothetical protein
MGRPSLVRERFFKFIDGRTSGQEVGAKHTGDRFNVIIVDRLTSLGKKRKVGAICHMRSAHLEQWLQRVAA